MEEQTAKTRKKEQTVTEVKTNPLRNEKIFVRFVPKNTGLDKRHAMWGGRADGAFDIFCVPVLRSTGNYKNILTNDEKEFLEEALGLDFNALSVYKKENNYWDNYKVRIPSVKEGLHLNLADPEDYIKYKVLLANSDIIAPSVKERMERPKQTYRYEMVREGEETSMESAKMDATMQSYKEFGKIDGDLDTMRVLAEILDSRPYAANSPAEFLRTRINSLIQADPRGFLNQITDPLLHTKVLIRRGTELGTLIKRGDYYYLKADNSPLCDAGEDPTLSVAARYLNQPSHQDIKFILEDVAGKNRKK